MKKTFTFRVDLSKLLSFINSRWFNLSITFSSGYIAFLFLGFPEMVGDSFLTLVGIIFFIDSHFNFWEFLSKPSDDLGTPTMQNPPPPPVGRSEEIKALFEFIKTRALHLESVQEINSFKSIPLWVHIEELQTLLSMYHNGELMGFLEKTETMDYDSFLSDADDYEFHPFPGKKL